MKRNIVIALVLIVIAAVSRLVPHVWNVAPVAAAAMLAGAIMPRKWAIGVPIVAMLISDSIIGFYHMPVMLTVYACFAASALMGSWLKDMKAVKVLGTSLASSTLFFIATNFAVWATADWYEKSWQGLALAYTLAIPFFRNTMLGDFIFTVVLFGACTVVRHGLAYLEKSRALNCQPPCA